MHNKFQIDTLPFTDSKALSTLVENRRAFSLDNVELNIYETYEPVYKFPLAFSDIVVINMLKGKKVMHVEELPSFDYHPGESVILPSEKKMTIDFPEANLKSPTQCTALTISKEKIASVTEYLNEMYFVGNSNRQWNFSFDTYHFQNDSEIARLTNKLFKIITSDQVFKDALSDITLRELLIRIMQVQRVLAIDRVENEENSLIGFVQNFIRNNLTKSLTVEALCKKANTSRSKLFREFKNAIGISPIEYVIRERIQQAKGMLAKGLSVKEACYAVGFSDVNYFVRIFKQREGVTPGRFALNSGVIY